MLDRLRLTGRVERTSWCASIGSAALVVVPSRYEGFGLPAVEAMACGTPVVATRAGALTEVMELTGGGVFAERDDPDSIAAGVRALLANTRGARADRQARPRARRRASLSWPRVARATAEVYAEILARRAAVARRR